VDLSWNASNDNIGVTGYNIRYRQGTTGSFTVLGTTVSTTFVVTGLLPNTQYQFYVEAFDAAGNVSDPSNTVTITTLPTGGGGGDTTRPTQPTNLQASGTTNSTTTLTWDPSTDDVALAGYIVYIRLGLSGSFSQAGTTTNTTFLVTGLQSNRTYQFYVVARDTSGNLSDPSNTVTITTLTGGGGGSATDTLSVVSTANGTVRLFNYTTGQVIQSFRPFGTAYGEIVSVALGDINNDGVDDIIAASRDSRISRINVYDGASALQAGVNFNNSSTWGSLPNGLLTPVLARVRPFGNSTGPITIASTDVNNDGFDDIVAATATGVGRVTVINGRTFGRLGNIVTPFGSSFTGGLTVSAGDVNGDNRGDIIVGTASRIARVKTLGFNGAIFSQIGPTLAPFGGVQVGVQVAAVDTDGSGRSQVAVGILDGGILRVRVFNSAGVQQSSFVVRNGVRAFAMSKLDTNQDNVDELQVAFIPTAPSSSTGNQIRILDPLTGAFVDGYDAFAALTGGISIDGN
jgi:chitodextrinase